MNKRILEFFRIIFILSLLTSAYSLTSFASQTYYYICSLTTGMRVPYINDNLGSVLVEKNKDGTYTADNLIDSKAVLKKVNDDTYRGYSEYDNFILDGEYLSLEYGDTMNYYSSKPFTGGWLYFEKNWYYFDTDGKVMTNQWIDDCYLGTDGTVMVNSSIPNGFYVWNDKPEKSADGNASKTMTSSGVYTGLTKGEHESETDDITYIKDVTINDNILILKGSMDYTPSDNWDPTIRLPEGIYEFYLHSGTKFGEMEDDFKPCSKASFESKSARGAGPAITVIVEDGIVSRVFYSA